MKKTFLWIIGVTFLSACQMNSTKSSSDPDNVGLKLPDGFSALIFADTLGHARHPGCQCQWRCVCFAKSGQKWWRNCLFARRNGDGKADVVKYHGIYDGTGIKLHKGYVYVGADTLIVRYKLIEGELVPQANAEIIAAGFDRQNQHETKPLTFDQSGNMYVTVGAPSNACQAQDRTKGSPGMDPCPILELHGGIWRFKDDVPNQDQAKDGYRYATGIRNAVAINWNNSVNKLYALQHGRDQLSQFYPEFV